MKRIDFLITNDGHHSAMYLPVIRELQKRANIVCRVISLCELRGFPSPEARYAREGVPLVKIVRKNFRRSPTTGRQRNTRQSKLLRSMARDLSWRLLLRRKLARAFGPETDLAILPNDGGFPYDRICAQLRKSGTPFLVLQEGIRFVQPHKTDQGQGGANLIGVWGESSAAYYRDQGAPEETIRIVGSPRFDSVLSTDWLPAANRLRKELNLRPRTLVFLSNPIEDLGFGTTRDRLGLLKRFAAALAPLFEDPDFGLLFKLHRRESQLELERELADLPHAGAISVARNIDLYPVLTLAEAVVVMATSAGLEALLLDKPLAVLEIPGFGLAHDYVSSGAARPLVWGQSMETQIESWLNSAGEQSPAAKHYLRNSAEHLGESVPRVLAVIEELLTSTDRGH